MLPDQIISAIRVGVAGLVSLLLVSFSAWIGFDIPAALGEGLETTAVAFVTSLVAVLYYALIRALASIWPPLEILLGYKASPVMVKTANVAKAKSMTKYL